MVNLAQYYGSKFFHRMHVYKNVGYLPVTAKIIASIISVYIIIDVFNVHWEYAFLKVCGLLVCLEMGKSAAVFIANKINYSLFVKKAVDEEVRHYLHVFNVPLTDDNSGCVEDYLLDASFNKSLEPSMNVLAAINYASVVNMMSFESQFNRYYYNAWLNAIPDYQNRD